MTMLSDGMLLGSSSGSGPIAFVSSATNTAGSGTGGTITINKPSGAQTGDLLIAIIWGSSDLLAVSLAGWTLADSSYVGNARVGILTRTLDGSEGSSFAFTATSAANRNGSILCYRGGVGAVDLIGTVTTASSATATAASITATHAGILLASFVLIWGAANSISVAPPGMTQRSFLNAVIPMAVYELSPSPTGASGSKTLQWGNSANNGGVALQIY